jgi:hypothetical protein
MDVRGQKPRIAQRLSRWHVLSAAAVAGVGCVAVWDAIADVWSISARHEAMRRLLMIPLIALWLVWVRRRRLRHMTAIGLWVGPAMVLAGWLLYWIGDSTLWQCVWHFGAILVVVGCAISVLGRAVLVGLSPAFLVLLFLIPLPARVHEQMTNPLESLTHASLDALGANAYRAPRADGSMRDSEGLRMVAAIVLAAYAFVFSTPFRPYMRILILGLSPIIAVLCNVVLWLIVSPTESPRAGQTAMLLLHVTDGAMLLLSLLVLAGLTYLLRFVSLPVRRYTLAHD